MDWRKNTVRPAQPRLARLAVSRSPPVFPRLLPLRTRFFSFDRAAPVLSTATAPFLRAAPVLSTAALPRVPPRPLHRLIPSMQPASRPLRSTPSSHRRRPLIPHYVVVLESLTAPPPLTTSPPPRRPRHPRRGPPIPMPSPLILLTSATGRSSARVVRSSFPINARHHLPRFETLTNGFF
jgi:hypothetical protein